jgi:hypothetical protein
VKTLAFEGACVLGSADVIVEISSTPSGRQTAAVANRRRGGRKDCKRSGFASVRAYVFTRRFIAMLRRLSGVTARAVAVVPSFLVIAAVAVLGRFTVMLRRFLVMLRSRSVVRSAFSVRHFFVSSLSAPLSGWHSPDGLKPPDALRLR